MRKVSLNLLFGLLFIPLVFTGCNGPSLPDVVNYTLIASNVAQAGFAVLQITLTVLKVLAPVAAEAYGDTGKTPEIVPLPTKEKVTFQTNDSKFQCLESQTPQILVDTKGHPGVYVVAFAKCGQITQAHRAVGPQILLAGTLFEMFTFSPPKCEVNKAGQKWCFPDLPNNRP